MKARKLRSLLNNTGYSISNHEKYIAVGSLSCHDLIRVNKETLKVKYALDTFNKGRESISNEKLTFIWDRLHELIESGEIQDVINGKDEIENPLPVFTVDRGQLIESVTDKYGWPNTDDDGICMYKNTHFPTAKEAIEQVISEYTSSAKYSRNRIKKIENDLLKAKQQLETYEGYISNLSNQLNQQK
jgi:hypothetical protein